MTTQTAAAVPVDAIDAALAAATPNLSEDEQRLAVAVFRLLAAGHPVTIAAAAQAAAIPEPRATSILRSFGAVFWDDHDQVAGFWGLALAGMPPHRIRHAGADLSAWCAFDPLFLARIIGDLDVATADPVSGEAITYHISGDGAITGASHPDAALSFLRPGKPWGDDVQTTFCHYVLHFTSPATARQWTAEHPGTFAISLDDASELARRHTARTFGTAAARMSRCRGKPGLGGLWLLLVPAACCGGPLLAAGLAAAGALAGGGPGLALAVPLAGALPVIRQRRRARRSRRTRPGKRGLEPTGVSGAMTRRTRPATPLTAGMRPDQPPGRAAVMLVRENGYRPAA